MMKDIVDTAQMSNVLLLTLEHLHVSFILNTGYRPSIATASPTSTVMATNPRPRGLQELASLAGDVPFDPSQPLRRYLGAASQLIKE
jgi:hypothetical protein